MASDLVTAVREEERAGFAAMLRAKLAGARGRTGEALAPDDRHALVTILNAAIDDVDAGLHLPDDRG